MNLRFLDYRILSLEPGAPGLSPGVVVTKFKGFSDLLVGRVSGDVGRAREHFGRFGKDLDNLFGDYYERFGN